MRFDHDAMALWYGTPDAPAPEGVLAPGADTAVNVAVQPIDANNQVELIFAFGNGPLVEHLEARWICNDVVHGVQYFRVELPTPPTGQPLEYVAVCRCAGRQVPAPAQVHGARVAFELMAPGSEPCHQAAHASRSTARHRDEPRKTETSTTRIIENDWTTDRPADGRLTLWGEWLPEDVNALEQWRARIFEEVESRGADQQLHPVILEFQELIQHDPVVRMYMTQMIEQIPAHYRQHHPKDVPQLLRQLNAVLTMAPGYNDTALVGTPFSAILIWTMGTPAGFAAYRNAALNAMFKKLLAVWTRFLNSEASRYVLNRSEHGWRSDAARRKLKMEAYQYDPDAPYWGFTSWNDFFTREIKPGARPIHGKGDPKIVVAACDSTVYRVSRGVKRRSRFWIKKQPYSLADMLDNELVDDFVGGDVFQAFLSPFNYHRWHSPVAGTVRKAYVKEGLYFSQTTSEGEDPTDQDHSQGYITQVQTRAIIFIDCDDPTIGLVCVMPVGMVEISSCIILDNIKPGARIEKGQELGYFQFGGSTHCVIFRPGAIKEFTAPKEQSRPRVQASGWVVQMGQVIAIAN